MKIKILATIFLCIFSCKPAYENRFDALDLGLTSVGSLAVYSFFNASQSKDELLIAKRKYMQTFLEMHDKFVDLIQKTRVLCSSIHGYKGFFKELDQNIPKNNINKKVSREVIHIINLCKTASIETITHNLPQHLDKLDYCTLEEFYNERKQTIALNDNSYKHDVFYCAYRLCKKFYSPDLVLLKTKINLSEKNLKVHQRDFLWSAAGCCVLGIAKLGTWYFGGPEVMGPLPT